jgi:hypothetical protein
MSAAAPAIPACPITGLPAMRLIQPISSNLLIGLWKASFGVAAAQQLGSGRRFGLWESPCGLIFFDPMIVGDLGCGAGAFASHVQHATYVGLDDNYPAAGATLDIRNESVAAHAAAHEEEYDAVCAFHVLEHVPLGGPEVPVGRQRHPEFRLQRAAPPFDLVERTNVAHAGRKRRITGPVAQRMPLGTHHRLGHWMGRVAPKADRRRLFPARVQLACSARIHADRAQAAGAHSVTLARP